MDATMKAKLLGAVTAYDKSQSKRPGYNRYALAHYAKALTNVGLHVERGHSLRDAIITEFLGRLCDRVLKAAGLEKMTDSEAKFGLAKKLPLLPENEEVMLEGLVG